MSKGTKKVLSQVGMTTFYIYILQVKFLMYIEVAKVDVYKIQFFIIRGWGNVDIMINITSTPLIVSVLNTYFHHRNSIFVKKNSLG